MATKNEVEHFLSEFFVKYKIFGVLYRNRPKNAQTLLDLEMSPSDRSKVIESIKVADYCEGPMDEQFSHLYILSHCRTFYDISL